MSTTYLGHLLSDESSKIVLKVPDVSRESNLRFFESECKVLQELKHETIVPFCGAGKIEYEGRELPYLMMKYIPGQSLRQLMESRGRLPWSEVQSVLTDILTALCCLQEKGLCHRDIKPDNIIYDSDTGHWVLVDFGIAKSVNSAKLATYTVMSQNAGTWDYMAPEQLDGRPVDIRCDIYSLGKLVWALLIDTVPRVGTKYPTAAGVNVAPDVDTLISRMVAQNVNERYQTPQEALEALKVGALRIESWESRRLAARRALYWGSRAAGIVALCALFWLVGDFYCSAELKKIAVGSAKSQACKASLESAHAGMWFGWGNRWMSENLPTLEAKVAREAEDLRKEFDNVKSVFDSKRPLKDKKQMVDNFIEKWRRDFPSHEFVRNAEVYSEKLDVLFLWKRAEKFTIEDNAEWKNINDEIPQLAARLTSPDAKNLLNELPKFVNKKHYQKRCKDVEAALEKKELSKAKNIIADLESIYALTPELKEYKIKLMLACWREHEAQIKKYVENRAFDKAWENLQHFEKLYPDENEYTEELRSSFNQTKNDIEKKNPCWRIHNEVREILESDSGADVRTAQLSTLSYRECDPAYCEYLKELIPLVKNAISSGETQAIAHAWYKWERPPAEYFGELKKSHYHVKLMMVEAELTNSYYEELAGWGDSDAKLNVYLDSPSENTHKLLRSTGPYVNQKSFEAYPKVDVYMNVDTQKLYVEVQDEDVFDAPSTGSSIEIYPNSRWRSSKSGGAHFWCNYTVE